jgi:hypothetical protein
MRTSVSPGRGPSLRSEVHALAVFSLLVESRGNVLR